MVWPVSGRTAELAALERNLRTQGAAVVLGQPGSGRTGLAREMGRRWERTGGRIAWCPGTPGADALPLGLLSQLGLPGDDLAAARTELAAQAAARPLLVIVDDAHLLDPASLAFARQLPSLRGLSLLLTVRSDLPVPPVVTTLWKDDGALRLELGFLDRAGAADLLEAALGAPLDPQGVRTLMSLSGGRPLILRELVRAAREEDLLQRRDGVWHLRRPPSVTPRLLEVGRHVMDTLGEGARRALESLALVDAVPLDVLLDLVDLEDLERLELTGDIAVASDEPTQPVRLERPMLRELVLAASPRTRLVRLARDLLDRYEAGTHGDPAVLATLWERAGRPGRPELFTAAARAALDRDDTHRAADLAARAVARGGGAAALLLEGEALSRLGRIDAADEVLARATATATTDEELTEAALLRFNNHLLGRGDHESAGAVVAEVRPRVTDPDAQDRLDAALAIEAIFRGDMAAARDACDKVLVRADPAPLSLLDALVASAIARTLIGEVSRALDDVERAWPLTEQLRGQRPLARDQIGLNRVIARIEAGRVDDAVTAAREGYDAALHDGEAGHIGTWAAALARALVEQGRFREADEAARLAVRRLSEEDPLGLLGTTRALEARIAAGLGEVDRAASILGGLGPARQDLRTDSVALRAEVWLLAARGELSAAAALALENGRTTAGRHPVWAGATLYDAVRLGLPGVVRPALEEIAEGRDAPLVQLFTRHAAALDGEDVAGLEAVARDLARGGMPLYAAEALAQAAELARCAGDQRTAARASTRAAEHLATVDAVPTAATPALLRTRDPLTVREREVALMARQGASSREIAERLVLSVRTVDNYLAAVYRKTGATGRHDLAEVLQGAGTAGQSPAGVRAAERTAGVRRPEPDGRRSR